MNKKQTHIPRKPLVLNGHEVDKREAIKLDLERAAGARIAAYLQGTIQQVLGSKEVENIIAGYLDGKDLKDRWGIQLRKPQFGEIWLIPLPKEPEPHSDPTDGPSASRARQEAAKDNTLGGK